ncbi:sensor histidine kinase [Ruicaihuangia caeni]|uniref:sensor histidine kinase n=1 Tax=Ruicaihuangia caeni TaxID=3042517 RepID=UPI00338E59F6
MGSQRGRTVWRGRAWWAVQDAALALVLAIAGVAEAWGVFGSALGDGSPVVSTLGVVAVSGVLALRRRLPRLLPAVFLLWLGIGVFTLGTMQAMFWGQVVPFMLALYSAARHGRGRSPWLGAGAAAATLLFGDLFMPALQGIDEILFHWSVCVLAFAVGWGLRVSESRAVTAALRASLAEREAREHSEAAVASERSRIARELHDILAHSVGVMVVQAGAAQAVVDDDPDQARQALAAIRAAGTSSLHEVRRVVALLRDSDAPDGLAPQPGMAGIEALVCETRATGLEVDLEVSGTPDDIPPGLALAAFRIVQESLTNVRKHSDGGRARVTVRCDAETLSIDVHDNGSGRQRATGIGEARAEVDGAAPGASSARASGHGLIGMRERAELYGGRLEAGMVPDGFRVRAVIPRDSA